MRFISAHNGKIQTLSAAAAGMGEGATRKTFVTGLPAFDALAPKDSLARGAVHELLFDRDDGRPDFVAALFAQAATRAKDKGEKQAEEPDSSFIFPSSSFPSLPLIWSDPDSKIYPPALAAMGFDLSNVYLLRPQSPQDESWAITECLRCRSVGAVIAAPRRMSRIEARRFQLAAERGGGVGIFLRLRGRVDSVYAAATRWLVSPHPGARTIQRWTIQLLHGHGGRVGQTVILERSRETNSVRAVEKLVDRQAAAAAEKRAAVA